MKANLYWELSSKKWMFDLGERPLGGADGVEFHGEYEISMKGAALYLKDDILPMVDYKGELHDLYTSSDKRPYIVHNGAKLYFSAKALK